VLVAYNSYVAEASNPNISTSVGCEVDNEKMELLLSQMSGREKFTSVPCGGGGATVAAAAPAAGGTAPAAEAKKEEKVEEKEESDDVRSLSLPCPRFPFISQHFLFPVAMKIQCYSDFELY
jgi:large subunit ribosomal protein LP2